VLIFAFGLAWLWGCKSSYLYLGAPVLLASFCVSVAQKRGRVTYGVSSQVRKTMRLRLLYAGAGAVTGTILFALGPDEGFGWLGFATPALWLVSFLVAAPTLSPLRVVRYQDGEFWLKGASLEFLDSLEEP
jgi:hypothetical protein